MSCFDAVEIHPQTPAQVADLARAEAHARTCAPCAERLEALREHDDALAEGLRIVAPAEPCPDAEVLAAWIDAGLPAGEDVEAHVDEIRDEDGYIVPFSIQDEFSKLGPRLLD